MTPHSRFGSFVVAVALNQDLARGRTGDPTHSFSLPYDGLPRGNIASAMANYR